MKIEKLQGKLNLENSNELSFFFLGVGNAFSKKLFQTNVLIVKGKNHILIDCGNLCGVVAQKYGIRISQIRNFFLTHSHADHIGGMEEVGFINYYDTKKPPVVVIDDKYKKTLWQDSLRGGMGYSSTWQNTPVGFDDFFLQLKPEKIKLNGHNYEHAVIGGKNGIDLKIFDTVHVATKDSRGKSFRSKGLVIDSKILFTGDTKFNRKKLDQILSDFNIEFIFHECIGSRKSEVHTSLDELKTLPLEIRKKMILCHYDESILKENVKAADFAGLAKIGFFYTFN